MEDEVIQYLMQELGVKVMNSYVFLVTGLVIGVLLGFLLGRLV